MAPGPPVPDQDYFTALPLETLQHISSYLDLCNKLKLRVVLKKSQENVVVNLLGDTLKTLYLSPNKTSIRHFKGLCESKFFQEHITKVVFLPQTMRKQMATLLPASWSAHRRRLYKDFDISLTAVEAQRSLEICRHGMEENQTHVTGKISRSIKLLPKLQAVAVCKMIRQGGLNADSIFYTDDYANKQYLQGGHALQEDRAGVSALKELNQWREVEKGCIGGFLSAVAHSGQNVRLLGLGLDLHDRIDLQLSDTPTSFNADDIRTLMNFASLEAFCSECCRLARLKICTAGVDIDDQAYEVFDDASAADHFLEFANCPSLQKLRIVGPRQYPDLLDQKRVIKFFQNHYDVLREVSFDGILFYDQAPYSDRAPGSHDEEGGLIAESIQEVLRVARERMSELQTFDLKVIRLAVYELPQNRLMSVKALDELAVNIGVAVKGGEWEFGPYVMAGRK